jgi:hypothetical protein
MLILSVMTKIYLCIPDLIQQDDVAGILTFSDFLWN